MVEDLGPAKSTGRTNYDCGNDASAAGAWKLPRSKILKWSSHSIKTPH